MDTEDASVSDESETNETDLDKYLEKAELHSPEAEKLLEYIKRTYIDPEFKERYWAIKGIRLVKHSKLVKNYHAFKAELQASGRKPGSIQDVLVFSNETKRSVCELCRDGVRTIPKKSHTLGYTGSGVHLVHHYDILTRYMMVKQGYVPSYIVVYKAVIGKTKPIVPRLHQGGDVVRPYMGFNCHVSARRVESKMPIEEAYKCSQIYFYEYNQSSLRKFPRQLLPYAVIEIEKKHPVHVEIPMLAFGSKVNLWEVKGETRRGFRFVLKSQESKSETKHQSKKRKLETMKSNLQEQLLEMRTKRSELGIEENVPKLNTAIGVVVKRGDQDSVLLSVKDKTDEEAKLLEVRKNKGENSSDDELSDSSQMTIPQSLKPVVTLTRLSADAENKHFTGSIKKSAYKIINTKPSETQNNIEQPTNKVLNGTVSDQPKQYVTNTSQSNNEEQTPDYRNKIKAKILPKESVNGKYETPVSEKLGLNIPGIDTRQVIENFKMLSEQEINKISRKPETHRTQTHLKTQSDKKEKYKVNVSIPSSASKHAGDKKINCLENSQDSSVNRTQQAALSQKEENELVNNEDILHTFSKQRTLRSSEKVQPETDKYKHKLSDSLNTKTRVKQTLQKKPQNFVEISNTSFFKPFLKAGQIHGTHGEKQLKSLKKNEPQLPTACDQPMHKSNKSASTSNLKCRENIDQNTSIFKCFLSHGKSPKFDAVKENCNRQKENDTNAWMTQKQTLNRQNISSHKNLSPPAADFAPIHLNKIPLVAEARSYDKKQPSLVKSNTSVDVEANVDEGCTSNITKMTSKNQLIDNKKQITNMPKEMMHVTGHLSDISQTLIPEIACSDPKTKQSETKNEALKTVKEQIGSKPERLQGNVTVRHMTDKNSSTGKRGVSVDEDTAKRVKQILLGKILTLQQNKNHSSIKSSSPNVKTTESGEKQNIDDELMNDSDQSTRSAKTAEMEIPSQSYLEKGKDENADMDIHAEDNLDLQSTVISKNQPENEAKTIDCQTNDINQDTNLVNAAVVKTTDTPELKPKSAENNEESSVDKGIGPVTKFENNSANQINPTCAMPLSKSQCKSAIIQTLNELSDVLNFLNNTGVGSVPEGPLKRSEEVKSNVLSSCEKDSVSKGKSDSAVCKTEPYDPEFDLAFKLNEKQTSKASETRNCHNTNNTALCSTASVKQEKVSGHRCDSKENKELNNKELNENHSLGSNTDKSDKNAQITDCNKVRTQPDHYSKNKPHNASSLWITCEHDNMIERLTPCLFDVADELDISKLEVFGILEDNKRTYNLELTQSCKRKLPILYDVADGNNISKLETFGLRFERKFATHVLRVNICTRKKPENIVQCQKNIKNESKKEVSKRGSDLGTPSKIQTITSQSSRPIPVLISSSKSKKTWTSHTLMGPDQKPDFENTQTRNNSSESHSSCLRNIVLVPIEQTDQMNVNMMNANGNFQSQMMTNAQEMCNRNDVENAHLELGSNTNLHTDLNCAPNTKETDQNSDFNGINERIMAIANAAPPVDTDTCRSDKISEINVADTTTSKKSIFSFSEVMTLKVRQFHKYKRGLSHNKFIDYNKIRRDRRRNVLRNRNKRIREREAKMKQNSTKSETLVDKTKIKTEKKEENIECIKPTTSTSESFQKTNVSPAKPNNSNYKEPSCSVTSSTKTTQEDEKNTSNRKRKGRRNNKNKQKASNGENGMGFFLWKNKYGRHFGRNIRQDGDRKRYLKEYNEWTRFQERESLRKKIELAIGEYRKTYDDNDKSRIDSKVASYLKYLTEKLDGMEHKKKQVNNSNYKSESDNSKRRSGSSSSKQRLDRVSRRRGRSRSRSRSANSKEEKEKKEKRKSTESDKKTEKAENTSKSDALRKTINTENPSVETLIQALIAERFANLTETLKEQLSKELSGGPQSSQSKLSHSDNQSISSQEGQKALSDQNKSSNKEIDIQFEHTSCSEKKVLENVNTTLYKQKVGQEQADEVEIDMPSYRNDLTERENGRSSLHVFSRHRSPSPMNNQYRDLNHRRSSFETDNDKYRNIDDRKSRYENYDNNRINYNKINELNDNHGGYYDDRNNEDFYDGRHEAARERERDKYYSDSYISESREINSYNPQYRDEIFEERDVRDRNASMYYKDQVRVSRCNDCEEFIDLCFCLSSRNNGRYNDPVDSPRSVRRLSDDYRPQYRQTEDRDRSYSSESRYNEIYRSIKNTDERTSVGYRDDYLDDSRYNRRRSPEYHHERHSSPDRDRYREEMPRDRINQYSRDTYRNDRDYYRDTGNQYRNRYTNKRFNSSEDTSYRNNSYNSRPHTEASQRYSDHDSYKEYSRKQYDNKRSADSYRSEIDSPSKKPRYDQREIYSDEHYYEKSKFRKSKDRFNERPEGKYSERCKLYSDRYSKAYDSKYGSRNETRHRSAERKKSESGDVKKVELSIEAEKPSETKEAKNTRETRNTSIERNKNVNKGDEESKRTRKDTNVAGDRSSGKTDGDEVNPKKRSYYPPGRSIKRSEESC